MTTMHQEKVKCCVCGKKSNHDVVGSSYSHGSSDLDTRPPEMTRSTIYYSIQRCPSCGYCTSDLSECSGKVKDHVESKEYQKIIGNKAIPKVAASFLALSYEKQQTHQYSESAWAAIHAAWICDDKNKQKASKECRKKAISMIENANAYSQNMGDQAGATEALTIDLMRRAGMFEQALKLAEETKTKDIEEIILQVIAYEESLIESKDIDSHTVSEALGDE